MARPRKLTRDPDKKPRSFDELQRIHNMAEKLYELTGGKSLDLQIAALDRTQAAYTAQMDAAELMKSDVGAGAWGPTVTPPRVTPDGQHLGPAAQAQRAKDGAMPAVG
jgi:hypothetical protein